MLPAEKGVQQFMYFLSLMRTTNSIKEVKPQEENLPRFWNQMGFPLKFTQLLHPAVIFLAGNRKNRETPLTLKGTLGVFWDPGGMKSSFFFSKRFACTYFLLLHGYKTRSWGQSSFVWLYLWVRMKLKVTIWKSHAVYGGSPLKYMRMVSC